MFLGAAVTTANAFQLVSLAAIWGSSFLFMRLGAPVLGAVWLTELRVAFAALFLMLVAWRLGNSLAIRQHWRHYLLLGAINSALPFLLFSYAAQFLSVSMLSILNATAPIWGAVILAGWTGHRLERKTLVGLALGVIGVTILVGFDDLAWQPGALLAIAAALGASVCYGIASTYARNAPAVGAFNNAHGSMWAATLVLAPLLPLFPASQVPDGNVVSAVVALGVLCTGIAYLLYFKLIRDIGAPSALTVTFLIPLFGILWGHLFLDEQIDWSTILGSVVVVTGTALVTGFSPARPWPKKNRTCS